MILASGRVIPNWILQESFELFGKSSEISEIIEDIECISKVDWNTADNSKLSAEDALEVFKKFNDILEDYDDMQDDFFEKNGLGHDEFDNDGGDDDNEDAPDSPEDNALRGEPVAPRFKEIGNR